MTPPLLMTIHTSRNWVLVRKDFCLGPTAFVVSTLFCSDQLWWCSAIYRLVDGAFIDSDGNYSKTPFPEYCLFGKLQRGTDPHKVIADDILERDHPVSVVEVRPGFAGFVAGAWEITQRVSDIEGFRVQLLHWEGSVMKDLFVEMPAMEPAQMPR